MRVPDLILVASALATNTHLTSLDLSCNELVEHFTCSELEHEVFDGCGCGACDCVEAFTDSPSCKNACLENLSCDDWVGTEMSDRYFYTCQNLEDNYGCDCTGCDCASTTTTTPPVDCATTTLCLEMDCQTVSDESGLSFYDLEEMYGCDCTGCAACDPEGCEGYSCDDWQDFFDGIPGGFVTCDALEDQMGCNCHGCSCSTTSTTTTTANPGCATTCPQLADHFPVSSTVTCDDVRAVEDTLACAYMETFYACDCSGCLCEEVPNAVCD